MEDLRGRIGHWPYCDFKSGLLHQILISFFSEDIVFMMQKNNVENNYVFKMSLHSSNNSQLHTLFFPLQKTPGKNQIQVRINIWIQSSHFSLWLQQGSKHPLSTQTKQNATE